MITAWAMYLLVASAISIGAGATFLPLAEHDDVLQPIGDEDAADLVKLADVAGVEPAIGVDDLRRLLGLVEVPLHDLWPAGQDLAGGGVDLDLRLGHRLADRAELEVLGSVDGEQRRRLGQAVALQDEHAHGVEELADLA